METNIGITILNLVYATLGAVITLIFMVIGYKTFDKITPFDTHVQLEKGKRKVGATGV